MPRTVSQMWETRRIELQCRCCLQLTCRVCTGVGHRKTTLLFATRMAVKNILKLIRASGCSNPVRNNAKRAHG